MQSQRRGFTLVEMSIVIVIIGLIVGGIVVGQSLVRGSQVASIGADTARVRQGVELFREKYRALPGDMANATTVWGAVSGGCTDATSTTKTTCNGNGDGSIGNIDQLSPLPATTYEILRAWQHLANAGMMEGTYTGGPTVASQPVAGRVGVNLPSVAFEEATMMLATIQAGVHILSDRTQDYVLYGRFTPNTGIYSGLPLLPLLTPSEAESVDIKLDDGKPGTGRVIGPKDSSAGSPNCVTTDVTTTADYEVTSKGRLCSLLFVLGDTNE